MDKISGILSASPRVTSVDMRESSPVRSSVPAFGRPEQPPALKEPMKFGTAAIKGSLTQQDEMAEWKSKDTQKAAIAAQLSDKFFNRPSPVPVVSEKALGPLPQAQSQMFMEHETPSTPTGFKTDGVGTFRDLVRPSSRFEVADGGIDENDEIEMKQPDGLFPKGSFIDRTA